MFQQLQPPVVETVSSVKRSENWSHPIPSIGLGRKTTTTTHYQIPDLCSSDNALLYNSSDFTTRNTMDNVSILYFFNFQKLK